MNRTRALLFCIGIMVTGTGLVGTVLADEGDAGAVGFWIPKEPPRTQYKIDFTIELGQQAGMHGHETIHFVNTTTRPLQTLAVNWSRLGGGGSQTLNVTAAGKPVTLASVASFPKDFALTQPLAPGEALDLDIEFGVSMPAPAQLPEEISISDWYPQLWWGAPAHCDYEVRMSVPKEYTVMTSGRFDVARGCYCVERVPSFGLFLASLPHLVAQRTPGRAVLAHEHRAGSRPRRLLARILPRDGRIDAPGHGHVQHVVHAQGLPGQRPLEVVLEPPRERHRVQVLHPQGVPEGNAAVIRRPAQGIRGVQPEAPCRQGHVVCRLAVPRGPDSLERVHDRSSPAGIPEHPLRGQAIRLRRSRRALGSPRATRTAGRGRKN